MYMLDIYHVMMALYDISKCVIERLEVILCNYLKVVRDVKTRQKCLRNAENWDKNWVQTLQLHTTPDIV